MTGRIEVDRGGQLAVHDLGGDVGDPLLVVCHATGLCGPVYRALAEPLAGHFHVVAPDFAGHGDSSPAPDYRWGQSARDLVAVLDTLAGGAPVLGFGHSLGGSVLLLAYLERPELFRAMYCYEPIVLSGEPADEQAARPLAAGARKRRPVFPSRAEALMRYASRHPLDILQAGVLVDYVEHGLRTREDGSVELKCAPDVEAASFEAPDKPTLRDLVAVDAPVTIAAGGRTEGPTASWASRAAEALPHGQLVRYDLLGHFGPLEHPAAVAAGVLAAFAEYTAPAQVTSRW